MSDLGPRPFRLRVLWLLLGATFLTALLSLTGDVLGYDDVGLLYGSAGGRGALDRSAGSFFTTELFYYAWLPFYGLSYWLDGVLGAGRDATLLFHLQNLLWHAATSYLVFCVLAILLRHRVAALLGALLFAVHPLHVESVAWIAGRKEVMSGCFLFLAWLLALRAEARPGFLAAALAAFLVACFTKASAVVLPFLLLAAALLLPRYRNRRRPAALQTLPFFGLALVPTIVHLAVGVHQGVVAEARPLGARLLGWIAAWGASVYRTLLPFDLSLDYPETRVQGVGEVVLPGLVLVATGVALLATRRRSPVAAFGIVAFFAALLPFNNVFPATETLTADRYLYLSVFGAAAVAAWGVAAWSRGAVTVAAICVLFGGVSLWSASRFVSDEELWTRTIAARDESALAWFNRGAARVNRARTATPRDAKLLRSGAEDLRAALTRAVLEEHRAKANQALIVPLLELGEVDEALERADAALRVLAGIDRTEARRFKAQVLHDRGAVLKDGRRAYAAAARDFHAAARLWPRYMSWIAAGQCYLAGGHVAPARHALERAAERDRTRPEPFLDLAVLHAHVNDRERQRRALTEAAHRAPGDARVVEGWIDYWLRAESPDYRKAQAELERLAPRSPVRRRLAAKVEAERAMFLFRRQGARAALAAADRAREEGLLDSRALYDLGQIYVAAGRYDDAVACYRGAADVLDRRPVYRNAVARAYALKSHRLLHEGDEEGARRALRAALDARPEVIEAGAAPLRGELDELRRARSADLLLLAAAAVAGDSAMGHRLADRLLAAGLPEREHLLVYRLRALLRAFAPPPRFKEAEDDLRQVLARDASDLWARYRLAQVWMRSGVTWIRTGKLIDSEARRRQGEELLERAIALLTTLVAEAPEFHHARLQRGEAYFASDDTIGAKADYEVLRQQGVRLKEVYHKEAALHRLVYVRGGDVANLRSADELCRRALEIDPNYFDALYELGNVHHLLYDRQDAPGLERKLAFNEAIFWYRRAMALNPRVRDPRLEWARLCLKAAREALATGELGPAHELVQRVAEDAPDVVEVWRERVRLNLRPDFVRGTRRSPDEAFGGAQEALERIEQLAPQDPALPELRSLYHRSRGYSFYLTWAKLPAETQPERKERARRLAVEEFRRAFAAWPADPENASVRDRLREIAPEVIVIDQQKAKEAYERGEKAFKERRWQEAAAAFREAVALFPESVHLRYYHAVALLRAGERDAAKAEFVLVANHPEGREFPEALYELGLLHVARDERLVARTWLERYVRTMGELERGDDPRVARARRILLELEGK
ncbi:MAG: tetratricopeptide repeat protein [Planctomycetota bacterium]|jgi:tetratricopeptide (TPR) repeat protein